jgi:rubrerythrin
VSGSPQKQCALLALHREGENQGLRLVFAMIRNLTDPEARIELARQAADEARHLWLLSRQIAELGRAPLLTHHAQMLRRVAIPKDSTELLATARAVKERALRRYAACPFWLDTQVVQLRQAIADDEKTHLAWLARRLALGGPAPGSAEKIDSYLEAEEAAYAALAAMPA